MRVHAIETGTVRLHPRQVEGRGGRNRALRTIAERAWTEPLPILAWLIEHPDGLIVVDTGESSHVNDKGWQPAWHPYFRFAVRLDVTPEQEIGPRLRALGFDPADVRYVVMTHLHTDHAGGMSHFPQSEFLIARGDWKDAQGFAGKVRGYLPHTFPDWLNPTLIEGEHVVADGVRIEPTPGHTPYHQSVVVEDGARTLFIAGDVAYREDLMRSGTADGVTNDPKTAVATLERIRRFVDERDAVFLPTHDPGSVARLEASSAPARPPAPADPSAA